MSTEDASAKLRLTKLTVRDFRGIDTLDLDFTDADGEPLDLIVLAGGNGSGKTAILEAILLALGLPEMLPKDAAPLKEQIRFGGSRLQLEASLRYNDRTGQVSLTADFSTAESLGAFTRLPGMPWPSIEYFSARREPEALGETPDVRGAQSIAEVRRIGELKRRLISAYYRDLRTSRQSGASESTHFARLRRLWERFDGEGQILDVIPVDNNPGSGDEVVLRDSRPIPEDVTSLAMARQLAPSRSDIPHMVPLDRLSSGQMALFAFAGPIIFRDRPADIVLIDEPEQHLHVQWQLHLLDALRELSPSTLFIVATHSEEILGSVLSYERFILVEESDPRAQSREDPATDGNGEAARPHA
jgi:predicted ATPase